MMKMLMMEGKRLMVLTRCIEDGCLATQPLSWLIIIADQTVHLWMTVDRLGNGILFQWENVVWYVGRCVFEG